MQIFIFYYFCGLRRKQAGNGYISRLKSPKWVPCFSFLKNRLNDGPILNAWKACAFHIP